MSVETLARTQALAALQSEIDEQRQQLAEMAKALLTYTDNARSRADARGAIEDLHTTPDGWSTSIGSAQHSGWPSNTGLDVIHEGEADACIGTSSHNGFLTVLEDDLAETKSRVAALEARQVADAAAVMRDTLAGAAAVAIDTQNVLLSGQREAPIGAKDDGKMEGEAAAAKGLAGEADDGGAQARLLSAAMIDMGDACSIGESAWECNLFAFHPCVGTWVSVLSLFALFCTVAIHVLFIVIVMKFMTDDPVGPEILDDLILFRASAAHAIEQADAMTKNPILAQICSEDDKLHLAGSQSALYGDVQDFRQGGPVLMVLAQLTWLLLVLKECFTCVNFAHGVLSIPRTTEDTRIVVAESAADEGQGSASSRSLGDVNLHLLVTVARIEALNKWRALACALVLVALRFALAVSLGYAGIRFLAVTASMSDLVLNSMALGFVFDLGSMFYYLFVPRRMHTLVSNTEPLPVRPLRVFRRMHWQDVGCVIRCFVAIAALVAAEVALNKPFFWRLQQAEVILCGGNQNFVYARNKATGVAHVARTAGNFSNIDFSAQAVLQAASPPVEAGPGWEPSAMVLQILRANVNVSERLYYLEGQSDSYEWDAAMVSDDHFRLLHTLSQQDVLMASAFTVCADASTGLSGSATVQWLQRVTQVPDLTGCDDSRLFQYCLVPHLMEVRATCPMSCKCLHYDKTTFFFQHPLFGCPGVCGVLRNAAIEAHGAGTCVDTDEATLRGKLDTYTDTLVAYVRQNTNFPEQVRLVIDQFQLQGIWPMSPEFAEQLHHHVTALTERFDTSMINWQVMPNTPHPRNLIGCAFLTSWEIVGLTGIDPCSPDSGRSLRFHCPEACFCTRGMQECPVSCSEARNA